MNLKEFLQGVFLPQTLHQQEKNESVHSQAGATTEESAPADMKLRLPKKPGKRPHPLRSFFAWIGGIALLVIAMFLFLKAIVPALILIGLALVIMPEGEDFLYKYFGFDFCQKCRAWIIILGIVLFIASLGLMYSPEEEMSNAKQENTSVGANP